MPVVAHDEQGVMVNDDAGIVFWPILKVAHTTMDDWLRYVGFRPSFGEGYEDADGMTHVAIVREPFARWVSAVHTMWDAGYAADTGWAEFVAGVEAWNQRTGRPWTCNHNIHFAPQVDRVAKMPDPNLFRLDDLESFRRWLGLDSGDRAFYVKNATTDYCRDVAWSVLSQPTVLAHYTPDVELWHSTTKGN